LPIGRQCVHTPAGQKQDIHGSQARRLMPKGFAGDSLDAVTPGRQADVLAGHYQAQARARTTVGPRQ